MYTTQDALNETQQMFEEALHSEDYIHVYAVANRLAGIYGWDEEAEVLRKQALRLRNNEWAYDESVSN